MEIALKGQHLTVIVPGRPSSEMKPEKPNLFSIEKVPGYFLQFIESDQGVFELQLHQGGQTFSLKVKSKYTE